MPSARVERLPRFGADSPLRLVAWAVGDTEISGGERLLADVTADKFDLKRRLPHD